MQTIIATLTAREGQEKELGAVLRQLVLATAEEPGALVYEIAREPAQPLSFVVYEHYRDQLAMDKHLASAHLKKALELAAPLLACAPTLKMMDHYFGIRSMVTEVEGRTISLQILPLGPANLVYAQTPKGILACGAIDPAALQKFDLPTARLKPPAGMASIATLDDLLAGEVREANAGANALGIHPGMSGREALRNL